MKSTFKWSLLLTSLAMSSAIAIAQPAPPPAENPPPTNARPHRPDRPQMSPEERRKQTEDRMRQMMIGNGITDASAQDAVLAYLSNELAARRPLRQMGVKLQRALGDKSITDDQIKGMIADYQNAQDLENQRRTKAQTDLDAKIHYSKNPRLEGMLMLMGVVGDGPPLMQRPRGPRQRGGNNRPHQKGNRGGGGNPEMRKKMMQMFDKNNDGKLNTDERAAMKDYRQQHKKQKGGQAQPSPVDNN